MSFEFDPKKSESNKKKHGIDFIEAQAIWGLISLEVPVTTSDEPRWLVIGSIDGKYWTAVVTKRGQNNNIVRIISVRRSRKEEVTLYEEE